MEKKSKGIYILVGVLAILCILLAGYIVYDKVLSKNNSNSITTNNNNSNAENNAIQNNNAEDSNTTQISANKELKSYRYYIMNFHDGNGWYLAKLDRAVSENLAEGEKIKKVSDSITAGMDEYSYIEGYYINDKLYSTTIKNNKLTIKVIDFSKENPTNEEYINVNIPNNVKDSLNSIIYMNDKNIYINAVNKNNHDEIYLLNIKNKEIKNIYTSTSQASLKDILFGWLYNDNLIVVSYNGILILDKDGKNADNILTEKETDKLLYESFKIEAGELYFKALKIAYPSQGSNKRIETTTTYKYNFDTKIRSIVNEQTETFN